METNTTINNSIQALQTCIPPKTISRNEHGLICSGVNYIYNENGFINWRKMIKPEFLVVKKDNFERKNKQVPTSTDGLEDKDLLILLGGLKELAQIRGFDNVDYNLTSPSQGYVAAVCKISFIPNYETEGRAVAFSAIGDAHYGNTTDLTKNYLAAIAENRAFVRCIRNFLKIPILGQDEIPASSYEEKKSSSTVLLEKVMDENGITFEIIKAKLLAEKVTGAEDFKTVSDIPDFKKFELIERIKKAAEAKNV